MTGVYKKYQEQGFHIIGLECQGSSAADIDKYVKEKGVAYQVVTGGELKGSNVSGIPHGFLFGPDGKLSVDNPRGKELEDKVKELLKDVAGMMAGPGPYKKLAALAAQVKAGQGLGAVLKALAQKKDSKDAEEAAEAKTMYDAIKSNGQDQLDTALSKKDAHPMAALTRLDKLALQFAGDELGTKAKQEADTLRKDPKVRKEQEADTFMKQLDSMVNQLRPVRGSRDPKDEAFRKLNAAAIQSIVAGCQSITQRYPGTEASQKAEELMKQYR